MKLAKLGLDSSTADMCYKSMGKGLFIQDPIVIDENYLLINDIPCWSIEALSELLPPYLFEFERGIDLNIYRNLNGKGWHVSYLPNNTESLLKDKFRQISNGNTLIEAVYNMILWLFENNLIRNGEK